MQKPILIKGIEPDILLSPQEQADLYERLRIECYLSYYASLKEERTFKALLEELTTFAFELGVSSQTGSFKTRLMGLFFPRSKGKVKVKESATSAMAQFSPLRLK